MIKIRLSGYWITQARQVIKSVLPKYISVNTKTRPFWQLGRVVELNLGGDEKIHSDAMEPPVEASQHQRKVHVRLKREKGNNEYKNLVYY